MFIQLDQNSSLFFLKLKVQGKQATSNQELLTTSNASLPMCQTIEKTTEKTEVGTPHAPPLSLISQWSLLQV